MPDFLLTPLGRLLCTLGFHKPTDTVVTEMYCYAEFECGREGCDGVYVADHTYRD